MINLSTTPPCTYRQSYIVFLAEPSDLVPAEVSPLFRVGWSQSRLWKIQKSLVNIVMRSRNSKPQQLFWTPSLESRLSYGRKGFLRRCLTGNDSNRATSGVQDQCRKKVANEQEIEDASWSPGWYPLRGLTWFGRVRIIFVWYCYRKHMYCWI